MTWSDARPLFDMPPGESIQVSSCGTRIMQCWGCHRVYREIQSIAQSRQCRRSQSEQAPVFSHPTLFAPEVLSRCRLLTSPQARKAASGSLQHLEETARPTPSLPKDPRILPLWITSPMPPSPQLPGIMCEAAENQSSSHFRLGRRDPKACPCDWKIAMAGSKVVLL